MKIFNNNNNKGSLSYKHLNIRAQESYSYSNHHRNENTIRKEMIPTVVEHRRLVVFCGCTKSVSSDILAVQFPFICVSLLLRLVMLKDQSCLVVYKH